MKKSAAILTARGREKGEGEVGLSEGLGGRASEKKEEEKGRETEKKAQAPAPQARGAAQAAEAATTAATPWIRATNPVRVPTLWALYHLGRGRGRGGSDGTLDRPARVGDVPEDRGRVSPQGVPQPPTGSSSLPRGHGHVERAGTQPPAPIGPGAARRQEREDSPPGGNLP